MKKTKILSKNMIQIISFILVLSNGISIANTCNSELGLLENWKTKLSSISDYNEWFDINIRILNENISNPIDSILYGTLVLAIEDVCNQNWQKALDKINVFIDNNRALDYAYHFRGLIHVKMQSIDLAFADFNKAVLLKPDNTLAYFNRGNMYEEKGQKERAFLDYTNAIRLNQHFALAYYSRGRIYIQMNEYENAIIDFDKAIDINPVLYLAYNDRAIVYKYLNQTHFAINDFNKAINIKPDYALAHFNKGNLLHELGQYKLAIKEYEKAAKIEPNNAGAYYNMGNSYALAGDSLQSISSYSRAIKIDPDYPLAYYNKAFLEEQLGLEKQAIESYLGYISKAQEYDREYVNYAKYRIKSLRKVKMHLSIIYAQHDSTAKTILSKLKSGNSFNELHNKYSLTSVKETTGWFFPGDLRVELEIIAMNLPIGEYSDIIKTNSVNFIIVKIDEQFFDAE